MASASPWRGGFDVATCCFNSDPKCAYIGKHSSVFTHFICCTSNMDDFSGELCEILQVRIVLRCTLCCCGVTMSGYITVQAQPGQLHPVGEHSVVRYIWVEWAHFISWPTKMCVPALVMVHIVRPSIWLSHRNISETKRDRRMVSRKLE